MEGGLGFENVRDLHFDLSSAMPRHSLKLTELELIQTQMTQKPMLRAEVYARALRASQNRKERALRASQNRKEDSV